eukprot:m.644412 g.644412  ORF g.644412 m.644412 type:complete len:454 (-) comp22649_c0_seq1:1263-2624(-)
MDIIRLSAVDLVQCYFVDKQHQRVELWLREQCLRDVAKKCHYCDAAQSCGIVISVILSMINDLENPCSVSPILDVVWNFHCASGTSRKACDTHLEETQSTSSQYPGRAAVQRMLGGILASNQLGCSRPAVIFQWAKTLAAKFDISFPDDIMKRLASVSKNAVPAIEIFEATMECLMFSQEQSKFAELLSIGTGDIYKELSSSRAGSMAVELYRDFGPPRSRAILQIMFEEQLIGFELYFARSIEPFTYDLLGYVPQHTLDCVAYFLSQFQHHISAVERDAQPDTRSAFNYAAETTASTAQRRRDAMEILQLPSDIIDRSAVREEHRHRWQAFTPLARRRIVDDLFELATSCTGAIHFLRLCPTRFFTRVAGAWGCLANIVDVSKTLFHTTEEADVTKLHNSHFDERYVERQFCNLLRIPTYKVRRNVETRILAETFEMIKKLHLSHQNMPNSQ